MSDFTKTHFEKDTWKVIELMFKDSRGKFLIKHQIDSYNDFILNKIEQILHGFNDIEVLFKYIPEYEDFKYKINIEVINPRIVRPIIHEKDGCTKLMLPNEARQRNFSYSSNLYVDLVINNKWFNDENQLFKGKKYINRVNLGKIPIMVGSQYCVLNNFNLKKMSDECKHDYGGYFIINGNEKVIISHDRIAENKTYVFLENKQSQYSHVAEIRSVPDNKFAPPKLTTIKLSTKATQFGHYIRINIHHVRIDVPIFILFRALGIENDKEIVKFCVYDVDDKDNEQIINNLKGSIEESNNIVTKSNALDYLTKFLNISGYPKEILQNKSKRINILINVLKNDFLPHVGEDFRSKALYLGYMINKLIKCFLGHYDMDDRDSYLNKRVDSPGIMMANLFRQYYGKVVKDVKNMIYKELNSGNWKLSDNVMNIINKNNIYKIFKPTTIESGLKYGLATGNWGIKNINSKQGVAQVLNRLTYNATVSHLRRINTPIEKSGKLIQPRKLHNTQWGIICPAETPEGSSVGLVKNLAMAATITVSSNSNNIYEYIKRIEGIIIFDGSNVEIFSKNTWIIVNGNIYAVHLNPHAMYIYLISLKRQGCIHIHTSISWNVGKNYINISTEAGRCVRPLYIVDEGNKLRFQHHHVDMIKEHKLSWIDVISNVNNNINCSLVEYLDVEENNSVMIAMSLNYLDTKSIRYSHLEIHPSLILGVLASNIPFSNHNQAPRNTYQSAMGKQAIGIYALNYQHRLDTLSHVLNYPQKPLVNTHMSRILNADEMPCGINVIVAIATYTGYNQEDSIMLNKSSVRRGLFTSTYYRTIKEQCNKNLSTGEEEIFCKNQGENSHKPQNYDKLEKDGFVKENTFISQGDVLIGKYMPSKSKGVFTYKDNSFVMKNNEYGYIDKSFSNNRYFNNTSSEGYNFAKIKIRNYREPSIGDKLSSKHGQKGSVGMLYDQEDMPFTSTGLVPDIIINPHAIPSRMTIAQLVETILGKACASLGKYGNATPFTDIAIDDIGDILENECNLERNGNEIMYNSRTGEQMKTTIFVGPTYYQRLKHMVHDKIHSRSSNGPIVLLTRQPAEGRARDGGLRLGEMEVECNWGHGCMNFLKERFMECSDNYRIFTCKKCGNVANVNHLKDIFTCNICSNKTTFSEIRIPFACKLLFQEIQSMGINTKYITK